MPPPAEIAPLIERFPQWAQDAITYGLGIGGTIAGAWIYVRRLNKPEPEKAEQTELVITSAALTNTAAFKELATVMGDVKTEVREVRLYLQELVSLAREAREEREQDKEVKARVEAELLRRAMKIPSNGDS